MKMAKASKTDLDTAMKLCGAIDALTGLWPTLPAEICNSDDNDQNEQFNRDDDCQCAEVLRYLLDLAEQGSVSRVVWGCAVMLDPRNQCVDPESDTIELHADTKSGRLAKQARPLNEWHEDMGDVLWWQFPVQEGPYCGTPNTNDWPGYHTHWTPLTIPEQLQVNTNQHVA